MWGNELVLYLAAGLGAVDFPVQSIQGLGLIEVFILVEGLVSFGH